MLAQNHRRFLEFLERRVGSREAAEDILQDAFVRGLERAETIRDEKAVIPWFYRLLRNAVIDHYRRTGAEERALAYVAGTAETVADGPDAEMHEQICACVQSLVETLKPEYAAAIKAVDLDGASLAAFAQSAGITTNNAGVRLHRAHDALRRRLQETCRVCSAHACLDCTCRNPAVVTPARSRIDRRPGT